MGLKITFDATNKKTSTAGLMLDTTAGAARGIGIQLLTGDKRYPANPGARRGLPFGTPLDYGRTGGNSSIDIDLIAQYLLDPNPTPGAPVTGGTLKTTATYTVEYQ